MTFDDFDDDLTVPMRPNKQPPPRHRSDHLDDFKDDLTVPMRGSMQPPSRREPQQPPIHVDDFDDDLTIPMRPNKQPPPRLPIEVEPPDQPVQAPGDAGLWTPPPRPTRNVDPAEAVAGIARWKLAAAAAVVVAGGVTALLLLTGIGDGDANPTPAMEADGS